MMIGKKQKPNYQQVPLSRIVPAAYHARGNGRAGGIPELTASIKNYGLLHPIILTGGPKRFILVAGLRRLRACKRLGWETIAATVLDLTNEEAAEISLIENLHVAELTGANRIRAIARLIAHWSTGSAAQLIHRAGITENELEATLRIKSMSPILKEALRGGLIDIDDALGISELDDPGDQETLIRRLYAARQAGRSVPIENAPPSQMAKVAKPTPVEEPDAPVEPEKLQPESIKDADTPEAKKTARETASFVPTHSDALTQKAAEMFQTYRDEAKIDFQAGEQIVDTIIRNLRTTNEEIMGLESREEQEGSYLPHHTIDVTRLAIYSGIVGGMNDTELRRIGLGAVLHDIGMAQVPVTILSKPGPLSSAEMDAVRKHTSNAHAAAAHQHHLEKPILDIILQHHERIDGSGYPKGLRGEEVYEMARTINIVDAYVAMTSARPYRRSLAPNAAMETLLRDTFAGKYDKRAYQGFLAALSLYPVGSHVQLADGEIAQVIGTNPSDPNRPIVNILTDTSCHPLPKAVKINLLTEIDCKILKAAPPYEPSQFTAVVAN